jgi:hypothetical protein
VYYAVLLTGLSREVTKVNRDLCDSLVVVAVQIQWTYASFYVGSTVIAAGGLRKGPRRDSRVGYFLSSILRKTAAISTKSIRMPTVCDEHLDSSQRPEIGPRIALAQIKVRFHIMGLDPESFIADQWLTYPNEERGTSRPAINVQ